MLFHIVILSIYNNYFAILVLMGIVIKVKVMASKVKEVKNNMGKIILITTVSKVINVKVMKVKATMGNFKKITTLFNLKDMFRCYEHHRQLHNV